MVEGVARGKMLTVAVREEIVTKTDGVRSLWRVNHHGTGVSVVAEHGDQATVTGSPPPLDIPATLTIGS